MCMHGVTEDQLNWQMNGHIILLQSKLMILSKARLAIDNYGFLLFWKLEEKKVVV